MSCLFRSDLHTHYSNHRIKVIESINTLLTYAFAFATCCRFTPDACAQDATLTEQSSAHLRLIWLIALCGALSVMQAARFECLSFDPFNRE